MSNTVKIPKRGNKTRAGMDPTRTVRTSPSARARRKGIECPRCGQHHTKCNGHRRGVRPWTPCMRSPIHGGEVCAFHGGKTPNVIARAKQRVEFAKQEGEVAALLRDCDLPLQHPIDGLLEVVRHSGGMMRMLGSMVAGLDLTPGAVQLSETDKGGVKRFTNSENGVFGYNTEGNQVPHVLTTLYGIWSDRYARACKLALDANIDERLVRNAESTTNALYVAVGRAIEASSLNPDQQARFSKTLADELRKLAGPIDIIKKGA